LGGVWPDDDGERREEGDIVRVGTQKGYGLAIAKI
jgi:hypothetical protein